MTREEFESTGWVKGMKVTYTDPKTGIPTEYEVATVDFECMTVGIHYSKWDRNKIHYSEITIPWTE